MKRHRNARETPSKRSPEGDPQSPAVIDGDPAVIELGGFSFDVRELSAAKDDLRLYGNAFFEVDHTGVLRRVEPSRVKLPLNTRPRGKTSNVVG